MMMSAKPQNKIIFIALVKFAILIELTAGSCFYVCNDGGSNKSLFVGNCSCQMNQTRITMAEVLNTSGSIHFENCTDCDCEKVVNTTSLEVGYCACIDNITSCMWNDTVQNNKTTITTTATTTLPTTRATTLCSNDTCLNGGSCIQTDAYNYTCNCTEGFTGTKCENVTSSKNGSTCRGVGSSPCLNNGTCAGDNSTCLCPERFNGTQCEHDMCSVCTLSETCSFNSSSREVQCANLTFSSHPTTTTTTTTTATSATTTKPTAVTTITEPSTKPTTQITTAHSTAAHTSGAAVVSTMTTKEDHSVTQSPPAPEFDKNALIIGLTVGIACLILIVAAVVLLVIHLKKSRATTGKYEPSREEKQGTNIYFNILALPPEERLI